MPSAIRYHDPGFGYGVQGTVKWHPEGGQAMRKLRRYTSDSPVNKQFGKVLWNTVDTSFRFPHSEGFCNSISTWQIQSWPTWAANILFLQISFNRRGHRVSWNNIFQHQNVNACRLPRILIMQFQIEYFCGGFDTRTVTVQWIGVGNMYRKERDQLMCCWILHAHTHTHKHSFLEPTAWWLYQKKFCLRSPLKAAVRPVAA